VFCPFATTAEDASEVAGTVGEVLGRAPVSDEGLGPDSDVELSDTWTEGAALEAAVDDTAGAPNDAVSPSVDAVGAGSSDEPFSEDGEPVAVVDKYRLGPNNFVPFPGPDSIPSSDFAAGGAVAVAAVEFTTVDGTVEAAVDGAASVDRSVDGAVDGAAAGAAAVDGAAAVEAAGAAAGVMLCLATTELYCCISITAASSNT